MRRAIFSLLEKELVVLIYEQEDLVSRTHYILTWNFGTLSLLEESDCSSGMIFRGFHEYLHRDISVEMKTAYIGCLTQLICLLSTKERLADYILLLQDTLPEFLFSSLVNSLRSKKIKGIALRKCVINDMVTKQSDTTIYDSIIYTVNHNDGLIRLINPISLGIIHNSIQAKGVLMELIQAKTDLPVIVCLNFSVNKKIFNDDNDTLILVGIINNKTFEVMRLIFESPSIGRDEYQIIIEFIEGWVGKMQVLRHGRIYNNTFITYPYPILMS